MRAISYIIRETNGYRSLCENVCRESESQFSIFISFTFCVQKASAFYGSTEESREILFPHNDTTVVS